MSKKYIKCTQCGKEIEKEKATAQPVALAKNSYNNITVN